MTGEATADYYSRYFDGSSEKSIVMLADRSFLPGILMTLGSVIKTGSLKGASIVLMTSDEIVRDHPFVQAVSRKVEYLSELQINQLSGVSRKHVRKGERHHLVAKYTLFKFFFFMNRGLGDQFFLDCDLIVVRNIDGICKYENARLMAAPAFVHKPDMLTDLVGSIHDGIRPGIGIINSGFMYAPERFLPADASIVHDLVKIAESADFKKEQEVVSEFFKDKGSTYTLPAGYNFLRSYMERIGEDRTDALAEDLYVVHYVQAKPWERTADRLGFPDKYFFATKDWLSSKVGGDFDALYDGLVNLSNEPKAVAEAAQPVVELPTHYFHIGAHKSGTTAIQNALYRSTPELSQASMRIIREGRKTVRDMLRGRSKMDQARFAGIVMGAATDSGIRTIFSDEDVLGFSGISHPVTIYKDMPTVARRLCSAMPTDAHYNVLFSIRSLADFIVSVYQQEVKRGRVYISFDQYVAERVDLEKISWTGAVETLLEVFGERLVIWSHESFKQNSSAVLSSFGLAPELAKKISDKMVVRNISLSAAGVEVMRAVNLNINHPDDREQMEKLVEKLLPAGERYPRHSGFTADVRENLSERYAADKVAIAGLSEKHGFRFLG